MQIITDAIDFKPPRSGQWGTPVVLALVAHALLMAALTWGVHWQKEETPVAFEAEIWSALPREAAPRAVEPPPPPPPPEPRPGPRPEPKPEPKPAPPPPQPAVKAPDIATEKAKKKQEEERKRELEEEKKEKQAKEKAEREKKAKELAEKKKVEEQKKLAERKKQEQERREAERREELLADKMRRDQLARMMGQAGASGGPEAQGTAQRSEGPSSGYGARVQARVRPNIRYTEEFPRSLRTEIEVRATADGTIIGRRVVGSSGNPAWDDAALKAIDRTGSLPRDIDGRVPSPIIIVVRPTD
jgi:colicin import membrane protein